MTPSERLLMVAFLLLTPLILGSCINPSDRQTNCELTGTATRSCPPQSDISGQYVLCLKSESEGECTCVNADESTPNGIYEAGTEVIATARIPCSEHRFNGWFDSFTGEFVSGEWSYTFILIEDTYLHVEGEDTGY
jgi:hypothetical protein